jgi:hypothetical protein
MTTINFDLIEVSNQLISLASRELYPSSGQNQSVGHMVSFQSINFPSE